MFMKTQFLKLSFLLISFSFLNGMNTVNLNNLPTRPTKVLYQRGGHIFALVYDRHGQLAAGAEDGIHIWNHEKKDVTHLMSGVCDRLVYNKDSTVLACRTRGSI